MTKEEFFKHAKTNINNLLETALSDAYNQGVADERYEALGYLTTALIDLGIDSETKTKIFIRFRKMINHEIL